MVERRLSVRPALLAPSAGCRLHPDATREIPPFARRFFCCPLTDGKVGARRRQFLLPVFPYLLSSITIVDGEIRLPASGKPRGNGSLLFAILVRTPASSPQPGRDLPGDCDWAKSKTVDETTQFAAQTSRPKTPRRRVDGRRGTKVETDDQESPEVWLRGQSSMDAAAIAARTALRSAPLMVPGRAGSAERGELSAFLVLASAVFRASALARVAGQISDSRQYDERRRPRRRRSRRGGRRR